MKKMTESLYLDPLIMSTICLKRMRLDSLSPYHISQVFVHSVSIDTPYTYSFGFLLFLWVCSAWFILGIQVHCIVLDATFSLPCTLLFYYWLSMGRYYEHMQLSLISGSELSAI